MTARTTALRSATLVLAAASLAACSGSASDNASNAVSNASTAASKAGTAASSAASEAGTAASGAASSASQAASTAAGNASSAASDASSNASSKASAGATTYTLAQVAQHKDAASCWVAIKAPGETTTGVYDVTAWITQHPGGPEPIKGLCGTNGTEKFLGKHGEDGPKGDPEKRLASFKIGTLS